MNIRKGLGLLAGTSLLGASAMAQPMLRPVPMMPSVSTVPPAQLKTIYDGALDRLFVIHAAQGNMFEVQSSRIALRKTRNAGVRAVANMIIMGHSMAQTDLAKVARAQGLPMPTMVNPAQAAVLKALQNAPRGAAFDKAYMGGQVPAHEATIVLFEHEMMSGKNATVRAHASNKLPGILEHTALIHHVAAQVNAPGINLRPAAATKLAKLNGMGMMKGGMMGGKMMKMSAPAPKTGKRSLAVVAPGATTVTHTTDSMNMTRGE